MHIPAVFRSTSPEVVETHRANVARGRVATAKWRRFMDETGLEPAIVFHPQGAIVSGVYPSTQRGIHAHTPPPGWFWDPARGLLAPAPGHSGEPHIAGRAALEQLADMEWVIDALPGIDRRYSTGGITCLDYEDEVARIEAVAVARRGDSASMEIDGEVWLILSQGTMPAVDGSHWERSRRYLLEEALFAETPALESLLA